MSLFIGFVDANVTVNQLECLFADTFDAQVFVRFNKQCKNMFGVWFKSATIEVCTSSPSFDHFISQVKLHGNNTFMGGGHSYKVQISTELNVTRVTPRIV